MVLIKSAQYKFYRNAVNRERKSCKAVFYETKVQSMKEENPKACWREVKRLSGARSHSVALCNHIHAEGAEELSPQDLANVINEALLESMEENRLSRPLAQILLERDSDDIMANKRLPVDVLFIVMGLCLQYRFWATLVR